MQKQGLITLDIDGTLTDASHTIPEPVLDYLGYLHDEGWEIAFITGRTYSYAWHTLESVPFSYYLCVQNGADIIAAREKNVISQSYIPKEKAQHIAKVLSEHAATLLYAGYERGDFCYTVPSLLSEEFKEYTKALQSLCTAPWIALEGFDELSQHGIPLIKVVGKKGSLTELEKLLREDPHITVSTIIDPIRPEYDISLITHGNASKGNAALTLKDLLGIEGPHIAAGDDRNDISMLKVADKAIVMATAPLDMHHLGDVVAPPATEFGIIEGISSVIREIIP